MLTFVTAFLDLCEDRPNVKTFETCFGHFQRMAATGISLVVFISKNYREHIDALMLENITCISINLEELDIYKQVLSKDITMPFIRSENKDTLHFMILMNAKVEFMKRAMDICVSSHYVWIDFSIGHVFHNYDSSLRCLENLSLKDLPELCSEFPGCWNKGQEYDSIYKKVNWRHCGGFFLMDRESLQKFCTLFFNSFPEILETKKTMMWEVNIWHILEMEYGWEPGWYKADHNDSILPWHLI